MSVSLSRLKELLYYCPATGDFTWLVTRGGNCRAGEMAGRPDAWGYVRINVDGQEYKAHRLAWLYMTGEWPESQIDHVNLIKSDNSWENLRPATQVQNLGNKPRYRNNKIGLKGVSPRRGKFVSTVQVNGKQKFLGYFDCPAAAHFAYVIASNKAFGEFSRAA